MNLLIKSGELFMLWKCRAISAGIGCVTTIAGMITSLNLSLQLQTKCLSLCTYIRGFLASPLGTYTLSLATVIRPDFIRGVTQTIVGGNLSVPVTVNGFTYDLSSIDPQLGTINVPGAVVMAQVDTSAVYAMARQTIQSTLTQISNSTLNFPLPAIQSLLPDMANGIVNQLMDFLPSACFYTPLISGAIVSLLVGTLTGIVVYSCCHSHPPSARSRDRDALLAINRP